MYWTIFESHALNMLDGKKEIYTPDKAVFSYASTHIVWNGSKAAVVVYTDNETMLQAIKAQAQINKIKELTLDEAKIEYPDEDWDSLINQIENPEGIGE